MNENKYADIIKSLNGVKTQQNKIISSANSQKQNELNNKFEDLLNTVSILSEENKNLKEKVDTLEHKVKKIDESATSIGNEHDIISELIDRQIRANNIIVFNLPENTNQDQSHTTDHDKLNNMFNNIMAANISNFSCFRLGKSNEKETSKPRPLKVILRSSLEAFTVLRSQAKLRSSPDWTNIRCASDRTQKQREHITFIRNEFQRRKNNGEDNIKIKYIKGMPNIVNTKKSA